MSYVLLLGVSRRVPPSFFGGVFRRGVSPEGEGQGAASAGEPDGAHWELCGGAPRRVAEGCELLMWCNSSYRTVVVLFDCWCVVECCTLSFF